MDSDETVKMVLFSILILIIGYLEYYNNKRIKEVQTQANNALTPSSLTVTAFRRDLDSIIKYVQSTTDGSLVLKSGKDSQTERMRISPVGNVGIGTNNPIYKLTVLDSNGGFFFDGSNSTTFNRIKSTTTSFTTGKDLVFCTDDPGTNNALYMKTNGNVGIGTNNPNFTLDVNGTANVNSLLLSTTTRSATSGLTSDGTHLYWNTTQIA